MSTHINENLLKHFIQKTIGPHNLNVDKARELGIDANKVKEADSDGEDDVTVDEILDDESLYEEFATLYVQEQEKEQEAKDKEQEDKEADERRLSGKSNSKA